MAIVLCGYVGYKVTDDLSLYAKVVMQFDDVQSAWLGTLLLYVRPVVGVAAGFLADWSRAATWLIAGFLSSLVGAIVIATGVIAPTTLVVFYFAMFATCIGVYAIRSLYFAAMQEGKIPLEVTGTAVGLISVVGYTPDIFMGPVMGYFLDNSPGESGHQQLFWLLAGFSVAGLLASIVFRILTRKTTAR
jgi:MFS family permease